MSSANDNTGVAEANALAGATVSAVVPTTVIVHPVVLLSVVDHFNRMPATAGGRVIGVLLGERFRDGKVDITNSFAMPFDEDPKDGFVHVNHNYLESMFHMFRKVSAKEKIVGWYHTGPKIRPSDLDINEVLRRYVLHPVLVVIDVQPKEVGLPTEAYYAVDELKDDGTEPRRTLCHIPSDVGAEEAEEVGVEHLLRDINDHTLSSLTNEVGHKLASLRGLKSKLDAMHTYLSDVAAGRLPLNHEILGQVQDMLNLLPSLDVDSMARALSAKANDMVYVVYLAALIRSIVALHALLNNKIRSKSDDTKLSEKLTEADAPAGSSAVAPASAK